MFVLGFSCRHWCCNEHFYPPTPCSVQHRMQMLQNVEENGRHACMGQHCSLQFCPRKFTDRLIPLTTIFLRVIFRNFRLPKRIGAECEQACAETMTGCGDLFAWGRTKCRDGGACRYFFFPGPNADNSSCVFVSTSVVGF